MRWMRIRATCLPQLRTTRYARCASAQSVTALTSRASRFVNQATIYDNQHFGSYVAVVEQFVNAKTDYTDGGVRPPPAAPFPARSGSCSALPRNAQDLLAVAWLSSDGTSQIHGDGLLAVGGTDTNVSVISMASSSVVALLKGHTNVRRSVPSTYMVLTLLPRRRRIFSTLQPPATSASL